MIGSLMMCVSVVILLVGMIAGIAMGIQQNFVLQEELPNGTSRIVGDKDRVKLREHLRFTALAPDDNS